MSIRNCFPLHEIPKSCFPTGGNRDQAMIKTLRNFAKKEQGYFMVRYSHTIGPAATFVLTSDPGFIGRWFLGRVRKHKTRPGCYELVIRRAKTCYYRTVDTIEDLADELRFLAVDADAELSNPSGVWVSTPDSEFYELGFSQENVYGHSESRGIQA